MVQLAPIPSRSSSDAAHPEPELASVGQKSSAQLNRLTRPLAVTPTRLLAAAVVLLALGAGIGTVSRNTRQIGSKGVSVATLPFSQQARPAVMSETATPPSPPPSPSTNVPAAASRTARGASTPAQPGSAQPGSGASDGPSVVAPTMVVHVAGAVVKPGVYVLPAGARAADAVNAAGGLENRSDPNRINLAAPLSDGSRLFVPLVGMPVPDVPPEQIAGGRSATPSQTPRVSGNAAKTVQLNDATADQLDSLPGIGPSTAVAIIEYRTKIGRFASVNQLLDVPGIGEAKLAAMRKYLIVG
jgi:competence protein ComEA